MSDQDFKIFVNRHWAVLAANLNLTDDMLTELHLAGVLTDSEYYSLQGNPNIHGRALAFRGILYLNPARMRINVDTMITAFQSLQRDGVVQVLQEWNPLPGQSVGQIQPVMLQPAPVVAQKQPSLRASASAENPLLKEGFTISCTIWCGFLDANNEILRQTLNVDNSIVETLQSKRFLGETEVGKIKKFSEAEKDERAIAFLELIRDKADKIETLIAAFKNDRHERTTPARLMSEFLQAQRQQVHPLSQAQVGHSSGKEDQRLWLSLLQNNREDLLRKLEIRNTAQLQALANRGCIDQKELIEINNQPEVVMTQRVHVFLDILARRQPPNSQMLTNIIEAFSDPLNPAAANIFTIIRGSMFPQA